MVGGNTFTLRTQWQAPVACSEAVSSRMMWRHRFFLAAFLRLRPALIRANRVRPSTPPLFHNIDRHFFDGQFDGSSVSGIHTWPQTSHTATRMVFQPISGL
jgi:hypothetical protein